MRKAFYKNTFYEKDGTPHIVEGFGVRKKTPGFKAYDAPPYMVFVDGAFYADAENGLDFLEEVNDLVKRFGWLRVNPVFA